MEEKLTKFRDARAKSKAEKETRATDKGVLAHRRPPGWDSRAEARAADAVAKARKAYKDAKSENQEVQAQKKVELYQAEEANREMWVTDLTKAFKEQARMYADGTMPEKQMKIWMKKGGPGHYGTIEEYLKTHPVGKSTKFAQKTSGGKPVVYHAPEGSVASVPGGLGVGR